MKIDDGVDNERYAGTELTETEKQRNDGAASKGAKHRDEAEDASDKSERQCKAWIQIEDDADYENGSHGGTGVDQGYGKGARNIGGNGLR